MEKSTELVRSYHRTSTLTAEKLKIIKYILNGAISNKDLTTLTKTSKSTISGHIKELCDLNLVKKTVRSGTQFLELTQEGRHTAKLSCEGSPNQTINMHDFIVSMPILSKNVVKDWGYINRGTHKNPYCKFGTAGFNVEINSDNAEIYIYPLYANDLEDARAKALDKIAEAIDYLYNKHNIRIHPKFKFLKQHIAFQNTPLATMCASNKIHHTSDRMHVDQSKGELHQEFVHPSYAYSDAKHFIKFNEEVIRNRLSLLDTDKRMSLLINNVNTMVETQKFHYDNLASHVHAIQTLSKSVDQLTKTVVELKKPFYIKIWKSLKKLFNRG